MTTFLRFLPALLLLNLTLVSAHDGEEGLRESDHSTHYELKLTPGGSRVFKVAWDAQPLKARWLFLLSAKMNGDGQVAVNLRTSGNAHPFVSYDWTVDGETHTELAEIPEDGFYYLAFLNSEFSNGTVDISFQFDQSCECTGKILDLDGGVVVFQQKVEKDEKVHFPFTGSEGVDFRVWVGVRNQDPLRWKTGFDIVAEASKSGSRVWMDYTAETGGTHYFFVESVSGTGFIVPDYQLQEIVALDRAEGVNYGVYWYAGASVVLLGLILFVFAEQRKHQKTAGDSASSPR